MAYTIGLRFYRIHVQKKGSTDKIPLGPGREPCDLLDYIRDFVDRKTSPTVEEATPRTWFFEPRDTNSIRIVHGYINYGTHGFESKLKDVKTREEKYKREATDLEEIPLYFQFWVPDGTDSAFVAFQSFQGRSCIDYVRTALIKDFADSFPYYTISLRVISSAAAVKNDTPVKTITLINPKSFSDRFDRALNRSSDEVDYEITMRARKRGGLLSVFQDVDKIITRSASGMIEFDGQEFESAKAEIAIGNKRRTVGILGSGLDAGLIDVSENIKRDKSGHPNFESIKGEVDELMSDFFIAVS